MPYNKSLNSFLSDEYIPENNANTLYVKAVHDVSFEELDSIINGHFGVNYDPLDFSIRAEYIHTRCINYDLYDSSDYDCYLVITKND